MTSAAAVVATREVRAFRRERLTRNAGPTALLLKSPVCRAEWMDRSIDR